MGIGTGREASWNKAELSFQCEGQCSRPMWKTKSSCDQIHAHASGVWGASLDKIIQSDADSFRLQNGPFLVQFDCPLLTFVCSLSLFTQILPFYSLSLFTFTFQSFTFTFGCFTYLLFLLFLTLCVPRPAYPITQATWGHLGPSNQLWDLITTSSSRGQGKLTDFVWIL